MSHAPASALLARAKLEELVSNGMSKAGPVVAHLLSQTPVDYVTRAERMSFTVYENGSVTVGIGQGEARRTLTVHRHAWSQLLTHIGLPKDYADGLAVAGEDAEWRRELLQNALAQHFSHTPGRQLVRTVDGEMRGFLSSKFRRLDVRPLLDAFIKSCTAVGAVPVDGVASDVRVSVRAILPHVIEPVPGEAMVLGIAFNNSDYGAGAFGLSMYAHRLWCINGAIGETHIKERHLGRELPDDIELSVKTLEADTHAMTLLTGDIVRGQLGQGAIDRMSARVVEAHASETTFEAAWKKLKNNGAFTKTDREAVKVAFNGEDTVMLPAGKSSLRFSNALSWVANQTDNADRKLDLQRAAGVVLAV